MAPPVEITVETTDQYVLARIRCEELDEPHSFRIEEELRGVTRNAPRRPLIIDLSHVTRIAGEALGVLVDLLQQCRVEDRRLILAGLQPQVLETLSVTRLGRLFEYRADVPDALAQLALDDAGQRPGDGGGP